MRALLLAALPLLALPAQAQLGGRMGGNLDIQATDSLEWQDDLDRYVATGNVVVVSEDMTVRAPRMTAEVRDTAEGSTEVWRVTAEGGVILETAQERAEGATGVYDLDTGWLVLTGGDLRFDSPTVAVTATERLEYNVDDGTAIASGDAVAVQAGDELRADSLTARFRPGADDSRTLSTITAEGNVHLRSGSDLASGDHGLYDLDNQTATLTGSVQLTRGQNQFSGDAATMDLATGVSRLTTATPQDRVRALLVPDN